MEKEHKYGEPIRITRKKLLIDDFAHYQTNFSNLLNKTKHAAKVYLESAAAVAASKEKAAKRTNRKIGGRSG